MTVSEEDRLVAQIEAAFANVTLEDGVSLNMVEYNDSGGTAHHFAKLAEADERNDWHRVITPALEAFRNTFSFTDLKGFRFYIPAYMIWTVRNHRSTWPDIADSTIYAINSECHLFENIPFVDWFTSHQVAAMVAFLEYCVANNVSGELASRNLRKIRWLLSDARIAS